MPRPMAVGGERAVMHLDEMPGRRQSDAAASREYRRIRTMQNISCSNQSRLSSRAP
jgi:hypothetical protein